MQTITVSVSNIKGISNQNANNEKRNSNTITITNSSTTNGHQLIARVTIYTTTHSKAITGIYVNDFRNICNNHGVNHLFKKPKQPMINWYTSHTADQDIIFHYTQPFKQSKHQVINLIHEFITEEIPPLK